MTTLRVKCTNCGREYPVTGSPYRCWKCGGVYDFEDPIKFDPVINDQLQPGIWKYRHTFNLTEEIEPISLGEGDSPLLWSDAFEHEVALKCEHLNPTGSFKDRGSSLIASFINSRNVGECIEDSSGNAGASMAAYAARAGIKLGIYIPESASGIKRKRIEAYGASLFPVKGTRSAVSEATKQIADSGMTYASHAYLPFNIPGYATVAYEIYEQLGNKAPGTVIIPVGQGGLLLGVSRGFDAIRKAGMIEKVPALVGVQARACAPLWSLFNGGIDGLRFATDGPTLAEGVRIWQPIRGDSVLKAIGSSHGRLIAVDEEDIVVGVEELARRGFHVEPTSALVWSALEQCMNECVDPIVLILTGS
jgi:threonine synthase